MTSDKLAVGRLIIQRADVLAEGLVQRVDTPAVPRHLDGVANRAFHLAGRRAEAVGNAGIKLLGMRPISSGLSITMRTASRRY